MAIDRLPGVRAVVFDVGETLVDETRAWSQQARDAGVTPFTLMAALGAVIAQGRDHREVWGLLGVPAPLTPPPVLDASDLYPDALSCLRAARRSGLLVGIAGNQPEATEASLHAQGFDADFIASSARWGVSKPSPAFFDRVLHECAMEAERVLYVGDRLDNDVLPARAAGMRTALLRRGPWGHLHAGRPDAERADLRLESLDALRALMRPSSQTA